MNMFFHIPCSTHFIDGVLGQTSTSHEGMRLGTTIEQLRDSIANPLKTSEPFFVNMKKNGKEYLDERIKSLVKVVLSYIA